jgi:hypothetical protein
VVESCLKCNKNTPNRPQNTQKSKISPQTPLFSPKNAPFSRQIAASQQPNNMRPLRFISTYKKVIIGKKAEKMSFLAKCRNSKEFGRFRLKNGGNREKNGRFWVILRCFSVKF